MLCRIPDRDGMVMSVQMTLINLITNFGGELERASTTNMKNKTNGILLTRGSRCDKAGQDKVLGNSSHPQDRYKFSRPNRDCGEREGNFHAHQWTGWVPNQTVSHLIDGRFNSPKSVL